MGEMSLLKIFRLNVCVCVGSLVWWFRVFPNIFFNFCRGREKISNFEVRERGKRERESFTLKRGVCMCVCVFLRKLRLKVCRKSAPSEKSTFVENGNCWFCKKSRLWNESKNRTLPYNAGMETVWWFDMNPIYPITNTKKPNKFSYFWPNHTHTLTKPPPNLNYPICSGCFWGHPVSRPGNGISFYGAFLVTHAHTVLPREIRAGVCVKLHFRSE